MTTTITSANLVLTIVVPGLYPVPVQISGFAPDTAFTVEAVQLAEVQMGVDGRMTAGYTPMPVTQEISLQADSPGRRVFDTIIAASKSAREILYISASLTLPSTGESFSFTKGVLNLGKQVPDAGKVLQVVSYTITWESVNRSLL